MSNEELAIRIQQGEEYLIPQLWEQVVKFIAMKAREYISHKGQQGLPCSGEETDLTNQAYFGFLEAVKSFNQDLFCRSGWISHRSTEIGQHSRCCVR